MSFGCQNGPISVSAKGASSNQPGAAYLFSGSGCRAATTPPRAAAERLARAAQLVGSLCAAGRGATRRSATSSTTLNRYGATPQATNFEGKMRAEGLSQILGNMTLHCRTNVYRMPMKRAVGARGRLGWIAIPGARPQADINRAFGPASPQPSGDSMSLSPNFKTSSECRLVLP